MKDHSVFKDKGLVIKNYTIENNKIIINYSMGEKEEKDFWSGVICIPYTKHIENKISPREKNLQFLFHNQEKNKNDEINFSKLDQGILEKWIAIISYLAIGGMLVLASLMLIPFAVTCAILAVKEGKSLKNFTNQKRELKKLNKLTDEVIERIVDKTPDNTEEIIDANSMDQFTLTDLKNIILNIKKYQSAGDRELLSTKQINDLNFEEIQPLENGGKRKSFNLNNNK